MSEVYRVCIYGAGGVGGYLAARLSQKGVDVTVVARGEHLRTIQASAFDHGLKLTSISGDFVASVKAVENPSDVGIVDLVVVACKSWQVEGIAPSIKSMLGDETIVVPTQNGIEAPERLAAVLGSQHVLGGYIRIQALVKGPGHILHDGLAVPELGAGELPGSGRFCKRQLERMANAFDGAVGVCLKVEEDVWMKMWRKLLAIAAYSVDSRRLSTVELKSKKHFWPSTPGLACYTAGWFYKAASRRPEWKRVTSSCPLSSMVCSSSGVCTASRGNIGEVVQCDLSATLFMDCLLETQRVALANGVKFEEDTVEIVWREFKGLAANSPTNTPSLMRDMLAGRMSELDDQLGAVVRVAARLGVDVPRLATLYAALMVQEQRNRSSSRM
eukprot:1195577-Prorocentrum_minimum.AAC.4